LAVFRYLHTALLSISLTLGANFFQRQHIAEVNQALARIAAATVPTSIPLKRLPTRQPAHDPATCPVCITLHAPMTAYATPPAIITALEPLAAVRVDVPVAVSAFHLCADHCRGPPMA
jgi:hypothetical protein